MELTQRRPEEKDCLFESLTWHLYLQYYSFTIQCHFFVCNGHRVSFIFFAPNKASQIQTPERESLLTTNIENTH